MTDLTKLSLAAARKGLKAKDFSAAELTEAYLSAIERANPRLNAYVAVTGEAAPRARCVCASCSASRTSTTGAPSRYEVAAA